MNKKTLFGVLFLLSFTFVLGASLETYCLERYCEPVCDCYDVDDCKSGDNAFWKASLRTVEIENFCAELFENGDIDVGDCNFLKGNIDPSYHSVHQAVDHCYSIYPGAGMGFVELNCSQEGFFGACLLSGCIGYGRAEAREYIHGKRVYIDSNNIGQCRLTSNENNEVISAVRENLGTVASSSFTGCTFGKIKKMSSNDNAILASSESPPSLFLYEWDLDKVGQPCDEGNGFCSFEFDSDGNIGVCRDVENIADFSDSFGYFCPACNENEKNAGTSTMQKFSSLLGQDVNRWTLKRITKSNGNSYNFNYEPKTWFTSRGDSSNKYSAPFSHVMSEGSNFQFPSGTAACSDFASGATCNSVSYSCASVGSNWERYSDSCDNILVDSGNLTVQANTEVVLRRIPVHDISAGDSFTIEGTSSNSDSLIFVVPYNENNNRINGNNLNIDSGSCSVDSGPNYVYLPGSVSSCTFSFNSDPDTSVKFIEVIARFGGGASFTSSNTEELGSGVNDVLNFDGVTWSATNEGLVSLSDEWIVYNTENSGIPSDTVNDLTVDDSGKLWLATSEGVASFDGSWNVYTSGNSVLTSNDIKSIEYWNGEVWIGTSAGLAVFDDELTLGQVCSGGSTQDCSMWNSDMVNCVGSCTPEDVCIGSNTVSCGDFYSATGDCSGSCSLNEVCVGDASITCQETYDVVGNCVAPVCGLEGACSGSINTDCGTFYDAGFGCGSVFNDCSFIGSCSGTPSCPSGSFTGSCSGGSGGGSNTEGPSPDLPFEEALNYDFECEDCDLSFGPEDGEDDEIPTAGACCFSEGPEMCLPDLEIDECFGMFVSGSTCAEACAQYPGICCEGDTPPQIEGNCPIGCDCLDDPFYSYTFSDPEYDDEIIGYSPSDHPYMDLTARQFCIEHGFDDFESYDTVWRYYPHSWYNGNSWESSGFSVFRKIEDLTCVRFASYACSGNIDCSSYSADDCPVECDNSGTCSGPDFSVSCSDYFSETDSCPSGFCSSSDVCVENIDGFTFSCGDFDSNCAAVSGFGCSSSTVCEGPNFELDCSSYSIGDCPGMCGSQTICEGSFEYDCSSVPVSECSANSGFGCSITDLFPDYLQGASINSIQGGDVLILGTSVGIIVYDGSSWTKYDESDYGFEVEITSASYESGKIIAGSNEGVIYFDDSWSVYNLSNSNVPSKSIKTVGLSSGRLLAGTYSDGLGVLSEDWQVYDYENGLSGNSINSLTFEPGIVYVGSNGGYSTLSLEVEGNLELSDVSLSRTNSRDFVEAECSFRAECEFESSNYYHPFPEGGLACVPNYGGGVRLSSLEACNDLEVCVTSFVDYEMHDDELGCDRTSGVIDLVPVAKSKLAKQTLTSAIIDNDAGSLSDGSPGTYREVVKHELDIRKPSHLGGPTITGGIMYNQVGFEISSIPGKVINKYFTTDSDASGLTEYFDDSFIEGGFIIR